MLKVLDTDDYIKKLLALPRTSEKNILAFYEHRLGAICKNPRLMLMPLDDHMAHRGDGVFETIIAKDSRLYQLPAHLARLGNELEPRKLFDQLPGDLRALPDEDDDVCVFEPDRKLPQPFDGVGVDLGRVRVKTRGAMQFAHCVLVIIKNHDIHPDIVPW